MRWAERWVLADSERKGWRGLCTRLFQIFFFSYREFLHRNCWERAATLSFSTIVSLIPLSVLFLSFLTVFWGKDDLKNFVETKLLIYLIPDEAARERLWTNLNTQVPSADAFKFHPGVNIMAVVGLVMASVALFVTMERMFNRLWGITVTRTYLQKLEIFWIILTTSPIAIAGSFYFDQLTGEKTAIGQLKKDYLILGALYSFLIPVVITFLAFTIVNLFLPYTRVRLRPALLGAGVSSILWEVGKKGFYQYVKQVPAASKFYGSLGVIPVFLLWVYITWLIVLLGVVITRSAQNLHQFLKAQKEGESALPVPPSPVLAVYLLDRVYSAFDAGGPLPSLEEVAERLGIGTQALEPIARGLIEKGLLIESLEKPGVFAPARASGRVRIHEVIDVVPGGFFRLEEFRQSAGSDPSGRRVLQLFQNAREAFLGPLRQRTLGDSLVSGQDSNN